MTHGNRIDDSWLYDEETIRVGIIISGPRTCSGCGLPLPASTDYFTPSGGGLRSSCKRCTRARYREPNRQRRAAARRRVAP